MKGRPKKQPEKKKKKSARVPFVASSQEKADYEWATGIVGHDYVSEWVRETLNAEVAKLKKKHSK